MNVITKSLITIEHHCLQLPYASLRIPRRHLLDRLVLSMENHGQLVPVVVVAKETNQWILMDGYLRVNALRRLNKDTINCEVWNCDLTEALLMLLTEHQSRPWEAFEEALLLHELHTQHGMSQNKIAIKMGRDKSWVCRRLSLLEQLSEPILQAMIEGKLSKWVATRILAPLARANAMHGQHVLNYLLKNHHSTRELQIFYENYQRSNHQQRSRIANDLSLFFKVQKSLVVEKQTHLLQAGPEGKWRTQLNVVRNTLTSLIALASNVFTVRQETHESIECINILNEAKKQFDLLTNTVRSFTDVNERCTTDNFKFARERTQPPNYQ